MPNNVIEIVLRAKDQASGAIKGLIRTTTDASKALRQLLGGVAGGFGAREVLRLADAYTLAQNRLRLYTQDAQELASVSRALTDVANKNRVALSSTAELYERISRAGAQLGLTQRQVIDTTDLVSKAITISGVSAEAANAAIVQFGQGLSAGALRGDELRSVLEQTPRLAKALADGLNVPIGQLRKLGEQGKLTSDVIIRALQSQANVLESEFSKIAPTIGQSFTTLGNKLTEVIGEFDAAAGVTRGLADLLSGEFVIAAGDAGFAVRKLGTIIGTSFAILPTRFEKLKADIAGTLGTIFGNDEIVEEAARSRLEIEAELDAKIAAQLDYVQELEEAFNKEQEIRRKAREGVGLDRRVPGKAFNIESEESEKRRKKLLELSESIRQSVETPLEAYKREQTQINELLKEGFIDLETYERALAEVGKAYSEALPETQKFNDLLEEGAALAGSLRTPIEQLEADISRYNELLKSGVISQETFNRAVNAANEDFAESQNTTFDSVVESARRATEQIHDAFTNLYLSIGHGGVKSFAKSFIDTIRQMLANMLALMTVQALGIEKMMKRIAASIQGSTGSQGSNFVGSALNAARSIFGFAGGGRPRGLAIVGEDGPELANFGSGGQVWNSRQLAFAGAGGGMSYAPVINNNISPTRDTDPQQLAAAMASYTDRSIAKSQREFLRILERNGFGRLRSA